MTSAYSRARMRAVGRGGVEREKLLVAREGAIAHDALDALDDRAVRPLEHGLEDVFLAFEVVVDGALGEPAQTIDDVRHGGALVSARHEELLGDIEDALDGLLRILVARHGASLTGRTRWEWDCTAAAEGNRALQRAVVPLKHTIRM